MTKTRKLERYFAVGIGLFCLLSGYTVGLLFVVAVELISRISVKKVSKQGE